MRDEKGFDIKGMFEDTMNFRELGGYPTADGKRVKHNIFYRSGMLGCLNSREEREKLEALGLRVILDFRSRGEAEAAPDPAFPGTSYYNICALYREDGKELEFSPVDIQKMFQSGEMLKAGAEEMMEVMYGRMAFDNPGFRKLFQEVEQGNVPILFHCSAGKDRTGVAALLLLLALGANEKTAIEDYELTNLYRRKAVEERIRAHADEVEKVPELRHVFQTMEGVDKRAAELVLERIREKYGSFERYFEAEYGLTERKLADLRENYLE